MNVFAVATVLDIDKDAESAAAWHRVEEAFHLANLGTPDLLHFSWHVAASYDQDRIVECLRETAGDLAPLLTTSTGLGIFTSEQPVLYLPIQKTSAITDLHRLLWKRLAPFADNVNQYYDPDRWIPHVTLAYEDANAEQISQTTSLLLRRVLVFRLRIDHFSLIYRNGAENGIVSKIRFGRSS